MSTIEPNEYFPFKTKVNKPLTVDKVWKPEEVDVEPKKRPPRFS